MNSLGIVPFMMVLDDFWARVEDARMIANLHSLPMHEAIGLRLVLDPVAVVDSFQERFWDFQSKARRKDIHDVLGGTDDGFRDNIACVISMGRKVYEDLIFDPDSLDQPVWEDEWFECGIDEALHDAFRKMRGSKAASLLESALLRAAIPESKAKGGPLRM